MEDVMLTFRTDVPDDRRTAILSDVGHWPGVEAAAPFKRDAANAMMRRLSFARVRDEHVEGVAAALRKLPEVESAEVAPRRQL